MMYQKHLEMDINTLAPGPPNPKPAANKRKRNREVNLKHGCLLTGKIK